MTTKVDSYGISKTYMNDQLVQGLHYDATYNGDNLDLAIGDHNGDKIFIKMDNDDIMSMFNKHGTTTAPLEQRISEDYGGIATIISPIKQNNTRNTRKKSKTKTKTKTKTKSKSKSKSKTKTKTKSRSPSYRKTDAIPSIEKTIF